MTRLARLGPGLIFASSAVGVSHLVQSTRAGAEFGLTLAPLLVLICLVKYPMFRFGAEYSAITRETVVAGYERRGRWVLGLFLVATAIEGLGVIPATSLVTAGLAMSLAGRNGDAALVTQAIVIGVAVMLAVGRYRVLENIERVFVTVFSILSVVAAVAAVMGAPDGQAWRAPFPLTSSNVAFAVAVAGWMPIGAGGAALLSVWVLARARTVQPRPSVDDTRFDFDLGYVATLLIALCFLVTGTVLLFGTARPVPADAAGFSTTLVGLFGQSIGTWARLVVAVAALAIMSSTVIATSDGFPRIYAATATRLSRRRTAAPDPDRLYLVCLALQTVVALVLLTVLFRSFAAFIDLVTTVGFFTAPVVAYLNHVLMGSTDVPPDQQPPPWLRRWSLGGIVVLTAACLAFAVVRLGA